MSLTAEQTMAAPPKYSDPQHLGLSSKGIARIEFTAKVGPYCPAIGEISN